MFVRGGVARYHCKNTKLPLSSQLISTQRTFSSLKVNEKLNGHKLNNGRNVLTPKITFFPQTLSNHGKKKQFNTAAKYGFQGVNKNKEIITTHSFSIFSKFAPLLKQKKQRFSSKNEEINTNNENKNENNNNIDESLEELKRIAETGNPKAQFQLASYYLTGNEFIEKDIPKALELLEKAAEKGEHQANIQLGDLYSRGFESIKQDLSKSFQYFFDSAKKGYPPAQGNVGIYYLSGFGVEGNLKEAHYWLTEASKNGNLTARCNLANCILTGIEGDEEFFKIDKKKAISLLQSCLDEQPEFHVASYHLGLIYYHGDGVEPNLREAYEHFYDASQNGNMEANHYLAIYYENGLLDGESNLSKAREYYQKACDYGYPPSLHSLASLYLSNEHSSENDHLKAKEYLHSAASKGYAPSIYYIGLLHLNDSSEAFELDNEEAVKWLKRAADMNYEDAKLLLGLCYLKGQGVPQDAKKAVEILSDLNLPESHFLLGGIYEMGEGGIEVDFEKSFMWYQLADAGGHLDAKYRIGLCYHVGRGVQQDKQQGLQYLQQAASKGHEGAKKAIYDLHIRHK